MILCCGEALIDMVPRRLDDGSQAFVPVPGGAVFNTAIAIGRLGAPVGLFTGHSSDAFGEMLEATLRASGVDTSLALVQDLPTTLAFVQLTDGQAKYVFYDENTAGRMLTAAAIPRLGRQVEALFCGGISLATEPCGAVFEALVAREAATRAVMLDPNIRPAFVADAAAYRARLKRMVACADIVKLSSEDLDWLAGAAGDDAGAAAILAGCPSLVIVTRGASGVTGYTPTGRIDVAARPVAVVDAIGAGDTFNAGLMTALHERGLLSKAAIAALAPDDPKAAIGVGVAAAAVVVSRAGANPPWRREIEPGPAAR